ncbi:hypothetical protein [Pseudoalteromonas rhizosphaerae]|uniref:hypothetical protein n=1 Tax=Pseudoalteromonas rhizosphaerae TaxID=2518973 RepID=UPI00384A5BF0
MRLSKLSLDIKLALEIEPPEPAKPLEFGSVNQEKGIQIFIDEYGEHYESGANLLLDEVIDVMLTREYRYEKPTFSATHLYHEHELEEMRRLLCAEYRIPLKRMGWN